MAFDGVKLQLRLSKSLHAHLKKAAKRNGHSINTEIINRIEGRNADLLMSTEAGKWVRTVIEATATATAVKVKGGE